MKPIEFKEQTGKLLKPYDMTDEECEPLPIHNTGHQIISCWKMSFRERLSGLFFGKVWVDVLTKYSHPPIYPCCMKTIFKKQGPCSLERQLEAAVREKRREKDLKDAH